MDEEALAAYSMSLPHLAILTAAPHCQTVHNFEVLAGNDC